MRVGVVPIVVGGGSRVAVAVNVAVAVAVAVAVGGARIAAGYQMRDLRCPLDLIITSTIARS